MTNRIIRRPSPHLTQTHRILSTARTLTPRPRRPRPPRMTTTRHPQMSNTSLLNTTPRLPPSRIFNPDPLCMQPVPSFRSCRGSSLVLSPQNPPTQFLPRDPGPVNPLPRPGRGMPCSRPSSSLNSATLGMQPVHSFRSRRGSSLVLSPHNPPTQLLPRYPTALNPLLRPGRGMPRLPPSVRVNSAILGMQPVHSFRSRRGSSLVLSPHNPPTQLLAAQRRPHHPQPTPGARPGPSTAQPAIHPDTPPPTPAPRPHPPPVRAARHRQQKTTHPPAANPPSRQNSPNPPATNPDRRQHPAHQHRRTPPTRMDPPHPQNQQTSDPKPHHHATPRTKHFGQSRPPVPAPISVLP